VYGFALMTPVDLDGMAVLVAWAFAITALTEAFFFGVVGGFAVFLAGTSDERTTEGSVREVFSIVLRID